MRLNYGLTPGADIFQKYAFPFPFIFPLYHPNHDPGRRPDQQPHAFVFVLRIVRK